MKKTGFWALIALVMLASLRSGAEECASVKDLTSEFPWCKNGKIVAYKFSDVRWLDPQVCYLGSSQVMLINNSPWNVERIIELEGVAPGAEFMENSFLVLTSAMTGDEWIISRVGGLERYMGIVGPSIDVGLEDGLRELFEPIPYQAEGNRWLIAAVVGLVGGGVNLKAYSGTVEPFRIASIESYSLFERREICTDESIRRALRVKATVLAKLRDGLVVSMSGDE